MPHRYKTGVCARCGRTLPVMSKGMCASCYRAMKRGVPEVDCFALDVTKTRGQCEAMEGDCRLMHKNPALRVCPFHRTKAEHLAGVLAALERIKSLPEDQQRHIKEKYYSEGSDNYA